LAWLSEADMLLAANPGHEALQVRAAWTRSAVLLELRREDEAEGEIHRAIDLAIQTGQERPEAGLRTNLSVVYWRRGEVDLAIEEVERSIRIFEETGERDQVALCESNLAELRLMQGRLPEALKYARSCWMTFRKLGDRQGTIISASVLLSVARVLQDKTEAEKLMEAVGEPRPGQPLEGIWTLYWLERSRWHRTQQQKSVAWHCVEQAARALGTAAPPYRQREVALARAELLYDRGQYSRAEPLADQVVQGAEDEMHWPVAWYARAVRSAARAKLGATDSPRQPPPELIEHNVPLALATAWYLAEAAAARGDPEQAALLHEEGAELAKGAGFVDWTQVFAR
jgi:tetratricopeptide (TPR) repeat protein